MVLTIGERLKELRHRRNLRQDQVAEIIGVNKTAISLYENGTRQPAYEILLSFARLYRVSTDYLLGMTNVRNIDVTGLTDQEIGLISELVAVMAEKNSRLKG